MPYEHELQIALEAARLAGCLILDQYQKFERIADAPASISTETDRQSQEIILQHVIDAFPNDGLCAEEVTPSLAHARRSGPRLWIVDPIDGTRGFARKNGEFSVMVALVDGGEPALGVVLEPARERLTFAWRDGGCWQQDGSGGKQACRVTSLTCLPEATVAPCSGIEPGTGNRDLFGRYQARSGGAR